MWVSLSCVRPVQTSGSKVASPGDNLSRTTGFRRSSTTIARASGVKHVPLILRRWPSGDNHRCPPALTAYAPGWCMHAACILHAYCMPLHTTYCMHTALIAYAPGWCMHAACIPASIAYAPGWRTPSWRAVFMGSECHRTELENGALWKMGEKGREAGASAWECLVLYVCNQWSLIRLNG